MKQTRKCAGRRFPSVRLSVQSSPGKGLPSRGRWHRASHASPMTDEVEYRSAVCSFEAPARRRSTSSASLRSAPSPQGEGILPCSLLKKSRLNGGNFWSYWPDLNRRPADYELDRFRFVDLRDVEKTLDFSRDFASRISHLCVTFWVFAHGRAPKTQKHVCVIIRQGLNQVGIPGDRLQNSTFFIPETEITVKPLLGSLTKYLFFSYAVILDFRDMTMLPL